MKILCIYGCGGMGRELADLAKRTNNWKQIIFIEDNTKKKIIDGLEVYTLDELINKLDISNLEFIVAVGEPSVRKLLYHKLKDNNLKCTSVIDKDFILSKSSSIKEGTIIHTGVIITVNVNIDKGCLININAVISHDISIGEYTVVSPGVVVGGNVDIGSNCYLGSGAVIRNGISIGDNVIIGMGSVVLEDVQANSIMVGNPAKLLRENKDKKVFK